MGIFKKIKYLYIYRRNLKFFKKEIEENFNAKVDKVDRIHLVVNVSPEMTGQEFYFYKQEIDTIATPYIKESIKDLSSFLETKDIYPVKFYQPISKIDKSSYLIILGYSEINTIWVKVIEYVSIVSIVLGILISII